MREEVSRARMKMEKYRVGVYLRLSREDMPDAGDGAASGVYNRAESNSIHSQRELALSFIQGREDLELYDFYVDDGYSGANFQRPGFRRLMEDIQAGKVDCVLVKDLSRFGRDYIEAGRLIQKDFPALHVRFIAVTDHFDSLTADENETSLVLPVKNFVKNTSYLRKEFTSYSQIRQNNQSLLHIVPTGQVQQTGKIS